MINSVRNTVLSILNKNNYGYISPADFNLFAKQAQLEIFEEYFAEYNAIINKENSRMSGTGYADAKKMTEEMIDDFSVIDFLSKDVATVSSFFMPSTVTTGNDYYIVNKVLCYTKVIASGTNTSLVTSQLVDSTANFVNSGVSPGDIVSNATAGTSSVVVTVSATQLGLASNIFFGVGQSYRVFDRDVVSEAERVSQSNITNLNNSLLTKPNNLFPAYAQSGIMMTLYPSTISLRGQVEAQYIRYPRDPKWTYTTLLNGEPAFDQAQPDFQDFELPIESEYILVNKILQYCGISIREADVYQSAKLEEREQQQS